MTKTKLYLAVDNTKRKPAPGPKDPAASAAIKPTVFIRAVSNHRAVTREAMAA